MSKAGLIGCCQCIEFPRILDGQILEIQPEVPHLQMLSAEFLALLRCPENQSPLSATGEEVLARLNSAIAAGRLKNRSGQVIAKPLEAALLRADGEVVYPIVDQIPLLIVDEGILVSDA